MEKVIVAIKPKKLHQVLRTNPKHIIKFMGPYRDQKNVIMDIRNPSRSNVAWRLLTTAPFRYFVRPRAGIILAGDETNVQITIRINRASLGMGNDRFKLQDFSLPDNFMDAASLWWNLDKNRSILMESRFIVYFGMPERVLIPENIHYNKEAPIPKFRLGPNAKHYRAKPLMPPPGAKPPEPDPEIVKIEENISTSEIRKEVWEYDYEYIGPSRKTVVLIIAIMATILYFLINY